MFARSVSIRLKAKSVAAFTRAIEDHVGRADDRQRLRLRLRLRRRRRGRNVSKPGERRRGAHDNAGEQRERDGGADEPWPGPTCCRQTGDSRLRRSQLEHTRLQDSLDIAEAGLFTGR